MTFTVFSFVFILIAAFLFFAVRKEWRAFVLLVSSWIYVYFLHFESFVIMGISTVLFYLMGIYLEHLFNKFGAGQTKTAAGIFICTLSIILLSMKFAARIKSMLPIDEAVKDEVLLYLFLPVGFSYYLFQAFSYFMDIVKRKTKAEKDPVVFLLYMSFFPKFVSGPIERPEGMFDQIKKLPGLNFLDIDRLSFAFSHMLYGYFLKVVIADRLYPVTRAVFDDCTSYSALWLIIGSLLYTIQIYCDFAGYSSIAVGTAKIFGIDLSDNFMAPYFSGNISEFWTRWHISLSSWLRDYIYIPLGGNRRGVVRKCLNLMIVFSLCGLWHGSGFKFIAWGIMHGVLSVIDFLVYGKIKGRLMKILSGVITFCAVSAGWIFFAADGLSEAMVYIRRILSFTGEGFGLTEGLDVLEIKIFDIVIFLISFIILIITDIICHKRAENFGAVVMKWKYGWRYLWYYFITVYLFLFGSYGPGFEEEQFMYMAF